MLSMDSMSLYTLTMGLAALLCLIVIWQRQRTGKTISVWLASGIVGILLGSVGSFAGIHLTKHKITEVVELTPSAGGGSGSSPTVMGGGGMGGMGGGGMGMGMGGGGGGMGMGGMGGGMGGGQPAPKRDLTTLVRKVEMLTGDITLNLSFEQANAVLKTLENLDTQEALTDDEAKEHHTAVLAILDDTQKAKLEAIGLPRPARGGGGFGGFGGGGTPPDPNANPFKDENNFKALNGLRAHFGSGKKEAAVEANKPEEKKPEEPKVEDKKSE